MLPGGSLSVDSLEDLDRVTGPQLHDRLLPPRLAPAQSAAALRLRLHLGDVDAEDLDVEQLLDRLPDLRLVRVRVDSERVRVAALDLRVTLLRHDRSEQDFVGMQAHQVALSFTRSSASSVTSTEPPHTSAATSSSPGVVTTTLSMLRKDLTTFGPAFATTTSRHPTPA